MVRTARLRPFRDFLSCSFWETSENNMTESLSSSICFRNRRPQRLKLVTAWNKSNQSLNHTHIHTSTIHKLGKIKNTSLRFRFFMLQTKKAKNGKVRRGYDRKRAKLFGRILQSFSESKYTNVTRQKEKIQQLEKHY